MTGKRKEMHRKNTCRTKWRRRKKTAI